MSWQSITSAQYHLSGAGPKLTPAPEKAGAHTAAVVPNGARGSQRMLVARLYERCLDRWPALPEAKRARRLQPPTLGGRN